ncbi:signal peptidase I [Oribacterium sp. WCC10]|uniref:signal peptidase I n=1 Tax=Oribacterium sp. WCC10 TaxID=1855343 RepID=UPI0008E00EDE|nr:signal peptidase I [Oribacterium sp. WCC10]SFG12540.1 signal peptidase, endoplasmic reticulum-type [Oribacterium sp. WCC10]
MNIGGIKGKLNKALALISSGFTLLLIFIALYTLVCSLREQYTGTPYFLFGWKPVIVLSDSMEPTYSAGEILLIREKDETPRVDDIVMFKQTNYGINSYVTHRIIGKDTRGYITKGDANNSEDPGRIKDEDIIGTVAHVLF